MKYRDRALVRGALVSGLVGRKGRDEGAGVPTARAQRAAVFVEFASQLGRALLDRAGLDVAEHAGGVLVFGVAAVEEAAEAAGAEVGAEAGRAAEAFGFELEDRTRAAADLFEFDVDP